MTPIFGGRMLPAQAILETLQSQLQEKDREREHLADALQEARRE